MSLLDDVSIVVTPNGYKAGELYAVVPVPTEGAELVTNGDFTTDSDWNKTGTWSIENNYATANGNSTSQYIQQDFTITNAKIYLFTYEIIENTLNGNGASLSGSGGFVSVSLSSVIGTHKVYITADDSGAAYALKIGVSGTATTGTIKLDNVSVKEYTSADMDVTRNTAATRVDENGLVNYALGVEEVTNGDFSNGSTDWTPYGSTFVVSNANPYNGNDTALFTASGVNGAKVTQSISTVVGNTYHLSCYAQYNSGDQTQIEIEGVLEYPNGISVTSGVTTFTFLQTSFTATSTTSVVAIRERGGNNNASCYLYGLSVKEVNNVPRIDYTGGGCPHILAEPQRTNLVTYSSDFTDSSWTKSSVTITPNSIISPDGSLNASLMTISGGVSDQRIHSNISYSGTNTISIFAKASDSNWLAIRIGSSVNKWYDLENGVLGGSTITTAYVDADIQDFGNGWYRCILVFTDNATTNTRIYPAEGNLDVTHTSGSVCIWGCQAESTSSYATSYIPTSGSTVTRNQDIFTRDGIGSLINSTEGVLFIEMAALSDDGTDRRITITDGTVNNAINIGLSRFSGNINAEIHSGGSLQTSGWGATGITQINNNKFALSWGSGTMKFYVNGSSTSSLTGITSPIGLNNLKFSAGDDTLNFFGKVKQLQVYNTALTDEQLLQLTGTSGTDFYESYAEMASALTYTIQ